MTDFGYGDGPRNRQLRVGDKERDAVGEILRQRHLEGRLDVDEFQAQRTHAIQQGVQIALIEVTRQDRDGRLYLHHHVRECLTRRRTERADHPDLVGAPSHSGLLPGSSRHLTIVAAMFRIRIIRRR